MIKRLYRNFILLFANMTTFFQEWLLTNIYSVSTTGIHLTWNLLFIIFFRLLLLFKMAAIALWAKMIQRLYRWFKMIQRLYRNCIFLFANMTTFFQEWLLTNIYSVSTTGIHLTWNLLFIIFFRLLLLFKMAAIALWAKKGIWKTLLKAQRTQGLSVVAKVWLIS